MICIQKRGFLCKFFCCIATLVVHRLNCHLFVHDISFNLVAPSDMDGSVFAERLLDSIKQDSDDWRNVETVLNNYLLKSNCHPRSFAGRLQSQTDIKIKFDLRKSSIEHPGCLFNFRCLRWGAYTQNQVKGIYLEVKMIAPAYTIENAKFAYENGMMIFFL